MSLTSEAARDFVRGLGIAAIAGVVLALSGAFTGPGLSLTARLTYWVPMMVAGASWGQVCSLLLDRFVNLDDRPWLMVATLTAVMFGPLLLIVWAGTGLFFERELYTVATMAQMAVPVLVITATMSAINVFVTRARTVETHEAPAGQAPARFLDRLPPKLKGGRLIAVQSEDHYLRLHTDRGSDLILMRLADALGELEGLEGAQTHRSWWVARDAVTDVARGDGRAVLTLDGGLTVPVSRRHARALRAAGWY
ncbi:LytTR family DNA-binding domain-containing protein [Brevundimonas sp. A19_0]|uniref:LytTR family DNA-binding domain-containing protein n=1 Tax=Brevundimonas sp. A19_0 TaxID=2821087 RepID=UPI001ADA5C59|nr:LytTR family DNA-binding domain-containing protein [Brevundimonas sp. A19_0]MBO9502309.1 LytTR family transcriptional regulator DNA-binding domain-containing protein [Brevundimonas sp. A19_0]